MGFVKNINFMNICVNCQYSIVFWQEVLCGNVSYLCMSNIFVEITQDCHFNACKFIMFPDSPPILSFRVCDTVTFIVAFIILLTVTISSTIQHLAVYSLQSFRGILLALHRKFSLFKRQFKPLSCWSYSTVSGNFLSCMNTLRQKASLTHQYAHWALPNRLKR